MFPSHLKNRLQIPEFRGKERFRNTSGWEGSSSAYKETVSVDPKSHLVYFLLENVDGHPLLRIIQPVH